MAVVASLSLDTACDEILFESRAVASVVSDESHQVKIHEQSGRLRHRWGNKVHPPGPQEEVLVSMSNKHQCKRMGLT